MSGSVSVGFSDLLSLSLGPLSHTADIPGHIQDGNDTESSSAWLLQDRASCNDKTESSSNKSPEAAKGQVSETTKKRGRCVSKSDNEEPLGTELSSAECDIEPNNRKMPRLQKRSAGSNKTCIIGNNPSEEEVKLATITVSYYANRTNPTPPITEIPFLVYLCCLSLVGITYVPKVIRWIMSHKPYLMRLKVAANEWYYSLTRTSSVWQEILESEDLKELTPNVELCDTLQATNLEELHHPVLLHQSLINGPKQTNEILTVIEYYGSNKNEAKRDTLLYLQNFSSEIMSIMNNELWHRHPMQGTQDDIEKMVKAEEAVIRAQQEAERQRIRKEQLLNAPWILSQNTLV